MKIFVKDLEDSVTGYYMVLTECTYEMALEWLRETLKPFGRVVWDIASYADDDLLYIRTGEHWGNLCRTFLYDESRKLLLGD
ncbi:MAG: hypothetical protein J6S85_05100 [Methanobrevibacter sp.]|nr:hypothetical protein [Methanobrevibacter sp.]